MLLCWGQRCASNFVSAVCVRQLPVSFVHKAGAHKETALNNCDRPSRKPDVNVIQHLFGDESGNWRSCWTSPSKFLQSGSKIAARLNPEPEVIVIIFIIIMWVECLGVHTLLYIYGSFDSLCPSLSQLVSLSLSLRPGRLPHFLPLLTEDQDPSLSPQKRMVSFFTAAKPLPLPGETRPEADYSKETVLTGPKCSWLWVWSARQINSIELILA